MTEQKGLKNKLEQVFSDIRKKAEEITARQEKGASGPLGGLPNREMPRVKFDEARPLGVEKTGEPTSAGPYAVGGFGDGGRREEIKKVENILAKDLEDAYRAMSPDKQKIFREEGEKTARQVYDLLQQAKVRVKKIINLIKRWLSLIPGVNRFFLEQEAKIKVDELMKLKQEREK